MSPTAAEFILFEIQTSIFTPGFKLNAQLALKHLQQFRDRLDEIPSALPEQIGGPDELPRLNWSSSSGRWRMQAGHARVDIFISSVLADGQPTPLDVQEELRWSTELLSKYASATEAPIGRVACVIKRLKPEPEAGLVLSRHFCKEEWTKTALKRPGDFELHAHKVFDMGSFKVNSWIRCKTGLLNTSKKEKIILVEQDLNTLAEDSEQQRYSNDQLVEFATLARTAFEEILNLYFPRKPA